MRKKDNGMWTKIAPVWLESGEKCVIISCFYSYVLIRERKSKKENDKWFYMHGKNDDYFLIQTMEFLAK